MNGVRTDIIVVMKVLRMMAVSGKMVVVPLGSYVVAAGTTTTGAVGRQIAPATSCVALLMVSVSLGKYDSSAASTSRK